jgi:hypothetical protein
MAVINNIDYSEILIHKDTTTLPLVNIEDGEYFGVIKTKISKTMLAKRPTFICFTIDKTGSMNEREKGNNTKMDYVIQTFVSMINYLSKLDTEIYIQVNAFNFQVDVLVNCVKITLDNAAEINDIIRNIVPDGTTDIGLALSEANMVLQKYEKENPEHHIAHIFMTDGEPTIGKTSVKELVNLVNESYNNIFVGYGLNHNVILLNRLGEQNNSEYQFVDNMENTGLVYGETIHKFIYPALRNVEFRIENGKFYDWQTNTWKESIHEDIIVSEVEKIYHIKTSDPDNVIVYIYGSLDSIPESCIQTDFDTTRKLLETVIPIPDLINMETGLIQSPDDLTKYAFRQKVQELLYDAKNQDINDNAFIFKKELKEVYRVIRKYMRINNLKDDGLLKMLCDDIAITYRTYGMDCGRMYAVSRLISQGKQRTYNTSSLNVSNKNNNVMDLGSPRPLRRPRLARTITAVQQTNNCLSCCSDDINEEPFHKYQEKGFFSPPLNVFKNIFDNDDYDPDDEIDEYVQSNNNTTCFATPSVLKTMRSVSEPNET